MNTNPPPQARILMLGWEFPPIVSGGLGLASLGLSRALAARTPISLIAPSIQVDNFPSGARLTGLNQLEAAGLPRGQAEVFEFIATAEQHIPRHTVYDTAQLALPSKYVSRQQKMMPEAPAAPAAPPPATEAEQQPPPFALKEAYGQGLFQQVIAYSKLAAHLAMQQSNDFDLIYAHDWLTFVAAIEIKRQTGKPLVLHLHSLEYDRNGPHSRGWVFELEQQAMREADLIIAVSSYTAQLIQNHYGIAAEKIEAIHNGLDEVAPYRLKKGFPEKLVLFLGRIAEQKGPWSFFELGMQLLARRQDVRFVMAGEGALKIPIMEEVARRRMGDRFHFTGFLQRKQVYDLLAMSDVLVMPSRSEPFGLAALEAAAFGVPVVISNYAGLAEVLPHAPRVEPTEVEQIAGHVQRLLDEPAYYRRLSQQLRQEASRMSWEKAAEKVLALFQNLLTR